MRGYTVFEIVKSSCIDMFFGWIRVNFTKVYRVKVNPSKDYKEGVQSLCFMDDQELCPGQYSSVQ